MDFDSVLQDLYDLLDLEGQDLKDDAKSALDEADKIAQAAAVLVLEQGESLAEAAKMVKAELLSRSFHRLVRMEARQQARAKQFLRAFVYGVLRTLAQAA